MAFRSPPPPLRSPTNRLVSSQTLAGRGGSVSRRDHNQAYRRRTQSQAEPIKEKSRNSNASRSSGGSAREGLLSEKPPPSQYPHVRPLFGREREGGCFSEEKHPPSQSPIRLSLAQLCDFFLFGVGATDDEDHQENGANVGEGRGQRRGEANGLQTHSQRVNEAKEQRSEENLRRV